MKASRSPTPPPPRPLLRADGSSTIRRVGVERDLARDLYHKLRKAPWSQVLASLSGAYVAANFVFAFLFHLGRGSISGARPGSYVDAFFFSVQTMATIGYGGMTPVGLYANLLVTIESVFGLLFTAMATGVLFTKFATPLPRVLFSRVALIGRDGDTPALMFRVANQRNDHMIVEAQVHVTLSYDDREAHGGVRRRLIDLALVRTSTPLFQLSWTVYHHIDPASPFAGTTAEQLAQKNAALFVTFTGIDDSLGQPVHTRHAYPLDRIVFAPRFEDILLTDEQGERYIDYRKFHDYVASDQR